MIDGKPTDALGLADAVFPVDVIFLFSITQYFQAMLTGWAARFDKDRTRESEATSPGGGKTAMQGGRNHESMGDLQDKLFYNRRATGTFKHLSGGELCGISSYTI